MFGHMSAQDVVLTFSRNDQEINMYCSINFGSGICQGFVQDEVNSKKVLGKCQLFHALICFRRL